MTKKQVEIVNKTGLHAKSVVRILAEGIGQGTKIEIAAEGADEEQAAASLAALVESGFGE